MNSLEDSNGSKSSEERIKELEHEVEKLKAEIHVQEDFLKSNSSDLLDLTEAGFWEYDIVADKVLWSKKTYEIFGLDESTPVNYATIIEHLHPDDKQRHDEITKEWIENGNCIPFEYRIFTPDGTLKYIEAKGRILQDNEGKTVKMLGVTTDISTRIQNIQEIDGRTKDLEDTVVNRTLGLEKSKRFLESIMKGLPVVIFATDKDGVFTYSDGKGLSKLGFKSQEVVGTSLFDLYKGFTDIITSAKEALQGKEIHVVNKLGNYYFETTYSPVINKKKEVEGMVGIAIDVTDRLSAEKEIIENKERYQRVIESSNTGIWEWHLQNYDVYFSPRWKQLLGYEDHELENKFETWQKLLHPDDKKMLDDELNEFLEKHDGNFEKQFRMKHKDGSYVWIQNRSSMHYDENGDPLIMSGSHQDITKIITFEDEIKKSELKFRDIFNSITECIFIVDFDGKIMEFNDSAIQQYGYSSDELQNLTPIELLHADYHTEFLQFLKEIEQAGKSESETIEVRKDGSTFYASVKGTLINYENKPHILAVKKDITMRKVAELDLQEAYEFNELILKNSQLGILSYNSEGQCVSANEAAANTVGATVDELLEQNLHDIDSWKQSGLYGLAMDTMKNGTAIEKTLEIHTTFGKNTYLDCYLSRFYRKDEAHLMLVINDVTEKTIVQLDRDRFFNTALALLCTASIDGYFLDLNPAWTNLLGYSLEELKSHKFVDFIHEEDIEETLENVKELRTGNEVLNFVNRYRCKDGTYKYLNWSSVAYGEVIYASALDITTTEEYKEKLELQTIELKRSNEELEQFAYVASHDLQEPLRKIKNFTQMLERNIEAHLDEKTAGYMMSVTNAVTRMQSLINDLLSYSRVSSQGKAFENTDLAVIMDEVVHLLELKIEQSGAKVQVADLPEVKADERQMIQLFQNLVSNALKFNDKEVPVIEVGVKEVTSDFVTLFVRDNGIGIEEAYREQIFTIFQRLHNRNEYEGTGIGLAICKKIVERHHGQIEIDSIPGKGTTFNIKLLNK